MLICFIKYLFLIKNPKQYQIVMHNKDSFEKLRNKKFELGISFSLKSKKLN